MQPKIAAQELRFGHYPKANSYPAEKLVCAKIQGQVGWGLGNLVYWKVSLPMAGGLELGDL